MNDLTGKVALVTGGSQGIGLGIAQVFLEQGAGVPVVAKRAQSLKTMTTQIVSSDRLERFAGDVSKSTDMQAVVTAAVQRFGGLDILVNSAGIQRYGNVVDTEEHTWNEVFDVNVKGAFLASKYAVPQMQAREVGRLST